jgi:hypothetical protein
MGKRSFNPSVFGLSLAIAAFCIACTPRPDQTAPETVAAAPAAEAEKMLPAEPAQAEPEASVPAASAPSPATVAAAPAAPQETPPTASFSNAAGRAAFEAELGVGLVLADQVSAARVEEWASAVDRAGDLDSAIARLEAAATAEAPPSLHFALSALYGRKGFIAKQYDALSKTEAAVAKNPRIVFNVALVHGRKETIKSREDFEALIPGALRALSVPAGAAVSVDGAAAGTAPLVVDGLKSGTHLVSFSLEGHQSLEQSVNVRAGLVSVADARLVAVEKAPAPAKLNVDAYPLGASLRVNGAKVEGRAVDGLLYSSGEYPAGAIRVDIVAPDFQPYTRELNLQPGSEFSLVARMERVPLSLPRRTIKVDGKGDDWQGIDPLFTDASKDGLASVSGGYDIVAAYVCRDDTYLYWRMDFADGKPAFAMGDKYVLTIGAWPSDGYDLEVGAEKDGTRSQIWSQKEKKQIPNGSYAAGPNVLEARFRLSQLTGFDRTKPTTGWIRVWRWAEGKANTNIDDTFRRGLIFGN